MELRTWALFLTIGYLFFNWDNLDLSSYSMQENIIDFTKTLYEIVVDAVEKFKQ